MPFSCMPVFAIVANVFDDSVPYCRILHFSGLGSKMRCSGQLSCLEWLGPQERTPVAKVPTQSQQS